MSDESKSFSVELREELFVAEYLVDLNVAAAARRCNVTEDTGRNMMRRDSVRTAIREEIKRRKENLEIDSATLLRELAAVAYANSKNYSAIAEGVDIRDLLTDEQAAAIQEITYDESRLGESKIKIKLYDKLKAIELLGKWRELKLWADVSEVRGPGTNGAVILEMLPIGSPKEPERDL